MNTTIHITIDPTAIRTTIRHHHRVNARISVTNVHGATIETRDPKRMTATKLLELFGNGAWVSRY